MTSPQHREFCLQCLKAKRACLCEYVVPFHCGAKIVILMHDKEHRQRAGTGTGRLTHQSIIDSSLFIGLSFEENSKFKNLLSDSQYAPFLLYPGPDAYDVSSASGAQMVREKSVLQNKIPLIFVLDASWSCAWSLLRANPSLYSIPKISFSTSRMSEYQFKTQPQSYCLSTLEAVHELLSQFQQFNISGEFESQEHHHLMFLFKKLVSFQDSFSPQNRSI